MVLCHWPRPALSRIMCQIREQHVGEPQRTRNCSGHRREDPRKKLAVGCSWAIVKSLVYLGCEVGLTGWREGLESCG